MGMFKRLVCLITASFLFAGCANGIDKKEKPSASPAPASELIANYHFIGTKNLPKANATNLQSMLSLPTGTDFKFQIFQKLAAAPGQLLAKRVKSNVDQSALLHPLLDDLVGSESRAEWWRNASGSDEFVLAVRLSEQQSKTWQQNLSKVAKAWMGSEPRPFEIQKFRAWEVKWKFSPKLIWLVEAQDWFIIGTGNGSSLPLVESWLTAYRDKKFPQLAKDILLESTIDWPKLEKQFPNAPVKLARTEFAITGRGETLRTTGRAIYPQNLNWKNSPWLIPTDLIRDPIVSFTGAQNLGVVVKEPASFQKLSVRPLTGQFYLWAQDNTPFHSSAAVYVKNADNALDNLAKELPATFNRQLEKEKNGALAVSTNGNEILWKGLSLIVPELRATNDYLLGGLFPSLRLKTPLPDDLLAQVRGRTNLVYYDWEITQSRMGQWQLLHQILPPFKPGSQHPPLPASTPSLPKSPSPKKADGTNSPPSVFKTAMIHHSWQLAVGPMLGNAITEITQTAPNELSFLRKSYIGLTGFELVMLTRWLNDPDFPLFGYQLPAEEKK